MKRYSNIWIEKLYYCTKLKKINSFFISIMLFFVPVCILFIPYIITRIEIITNYSTLTKISFGLASIWCFLGPYLIFKYYNNMNIFWRNISQINNSSDKKNINIEYLKEKYLKINKKIIIITTIIWNIIIIGAIIVCPKKLEYYGFFGLNDIYFYILIIYVSFLIHLQAIGFSGVLTTMMIIIYFSKNDRLIEDILEEHNDKGMCVFGSFSFKTTIYFSSGIVYIPLLITYMNNANQLVKIFIVLAIILYSLFLVLSFLIPNFILNKNAKQKKEKIINEAKSMYATHIRNCILVTKNNYKLVETNITEEIQMLNLYNHINMLQQISTYPVTLKWTITIITTGLIPIILFVFNIITKVDSLEKGLSFVFKFID